MNEVGDCFLLERTSTFDCERAAKFEVDAFGWIDPANVFKPFAITPRIGFEGDWHYGDLGFRCKLKPNRIELFGVESEAASGLWKNDD